MGSLHEDPGMFMIISRPVLRVGNVSHKSYREKTHILCSVTFSSRKSCRLWDNTGNYGRARQATDNNIRVIWRMRVSCWIPKATDTHSEYVIVAFQRQQWLHERACYVIVHCPSCVFGVAYRHFPTEHNRPRIIHNYDNDTIDKKNKPAYGLMECIRVHVVSSLCLV